jgi:hypothetical protein
MFNPIRHPYQIGVEDGGGSIHCNRMYSPPEKLVQLRYHETFQHWVHGPEGRIVLAFMGDAPEPVCAINEVITIKIRDYVIECKKTAPAQFMILKIKASNGALFNTLQLHHTDPLVKMIRAFVTVPVTDMYK